MWGGDLRHAPCQRPAAIRPPGGNPGGCPALLRALRVPWRLDAGHLRRGRHEPGQPLPLFPLERGDHRRHRRARPRRGRAAVRQRRSLARTSSRCSKAWRTTISSERPDEEVALCAEIMAESPPQSGDRPHLGGVRRRREGVAGRPCCGAAAERGDIRARRRFRRRRHHADGHRRRRLVAPRGRSDFRRRSACCRSSWISRATCCWQPTRHNGAPSAPERRVR